jgi:hypothetical protein
MGIIQEIKADDNEYFDLNLSDKKYADFLNLDGKVMIGNDIMSINECEKKIYINANLFESLRTKQKFLGKFCIWKLVTTGKI